MNNPTIDYPVKPVSSINELLESSFMLYRNQPAFICEGNIITYDNLYNDVSRLSSKLISYRKKYVVLCCENKYYFSVAFFASVICGCIAMLPPAMTEEYKNICFSAGTDILIDDSFVLLALSSGKLTGVDYETNPTDVCTVLFSSGTSSTPKGVMLSQRNICTNITSGIQRYYSPPEAVYCSILPYYHAFGLTCDLLTPLYTGGKICLPKNKMSFFAELPQFAPDALYVPPAVAMWLLHGIKTGLNLSELTGGKLKKMLCGGAGISYKDASELEKYGVLALGCYGMSECSPGITINGDKKFRHGSSGLAMSCNEVCIDNGEIIVRGSNVMVGYLNDINATSAAIRDGWLHTGDLGYFDEDGFLYISGRIDNLISFSDGTKCIPEDVETIVDSIVGVKESLLYSLGDHLKLIVHSDSNNITKQSIMDTLKTSNFEHISRITNIILTNNQFIRNTLGKINRKAVIEKFE